MKHLTFLFICVAITLCHASSAMGHLHPQLQRFVQRDPIDYFDGMNLYLAYGSQLPNMLDPSGLAAKACPPGQCPLPKPGYTPTFNGCGPDGWKGKLVPDSPFGFPFRVPCNEHDTCYGTCNTSKAFCDEDFRAGLRAWCRLSMNTAYGHVPSEAEIAQLNACLLLADIYAAAVKKAGEEFHTGGQEEACVCGPCKCPATQPEGRIRVSTESARIKAGWASKGFGGLMIQNAVGR